MEKRIPQREKVTMAFFILLMFILACCVLLVIKYKKDNVPFSIKFDASEDGMIRAEEMGVWVEIEPQESISNGSLPVKLSYTRYNGTVENNNKKNIKDWQLKIFLKDNEFTIVTDWNGTYVKSGKEITVIPDYNINEIKAGNRSDFGYIMLAENIYDKYRFELSGSFCTNIEDYFLYKLIVSVVVVWVAGFVTHGVSNFAEQKKQKHDEEVIVQSMGMIAEFIEKRDAYVQGHSLRVAKYSMLIAEKMGFSKEMVRNIGYTALMHDCGKIGIPDNVLNKPGKLGEEERKIIESHTTMGGQILESFTAINGMREGALYHHERYDGHGYPEGIKGKQIPLFARIICVADSFDAMNSDRCYRKRLDEKVIVNEIEENLGKQFDPEIGRCMLLLIREGKIKVGANV